MLRADTRACSLARNVGTKEACPESGKCAFWEPAIDRAGGRCGVERLGLDHLGPAVSRFLLERRRIPVTRAERPELPHLPGF